MKTPKEKEEMFKAMVLNLVAMFEKGLIEIAPSIRNEVVASFKKLRFDVTGELDISSVDSRIKFLANAAIERQEGFEVREKISLLEIQSSYFKLIQKNFGQWYKVMVNNKSTPHEVAEHFSSPNIDSGNLNEAITPLLNIITEFWDQVADSAYSHLTEDHKSTKAVFGGELFPETDQNIVSKCGIYTDTIIFPCPFMRTKPLIHGMGREEKLYYILRTALEILHYREVAIADVQRPIVVILPDLEMMDETEYNKTQDLGLLDGIYHAQKIFGRNFESADELFEFCHSLDTIEKVLAKVVDKDKLLIDIKDKEPLKVQLQKHLTSQTFTYAESKHPGFLASMLGVGRMGICNELLKKSSTIGGVPLIDSPTSWEYFKWKTEYDAERAYPDKDHSQLHTLKGVGSLSNSNLYWVGQIPHQGLIEIRKSGALDEIRAILSKGVSELVSANNIDYQSTTHRVYNNLNHAFNEHQKRIKHLRNKKWKIAGRDIGSYIVLGSLEIASVCTSIPSIGVSAIVLGKVLDLTDTVNLNPKVTINKWNSIKSESLAQENSSVGLIFKYKPEKS